MPYGVSGRSGGHWQQCGCRYVLWESGRSVATTGPLTGQVDGSFPLGEDCSCEQACLMCSDAVGVMAREVSMKLRAGCSWNEPVSGQKQSAGSTPSLQYVLTHTVSCKVVCVRHCAVMVTRQKSDTHTCACRPLFTVR